MRQQGLFESTDEFPAGMRHEPALISPDEEQDVAGPPTKAAIQGVRVSRVSRERGAAFFGWRYSFDGSGLQEAAEIPNFLLPVRVGHCDGHCK